MVRCLIITCRKCRRSCRLSALHLRGVTTRCSAHFPTSSDVVIYSLICGLSITRHEVYVAWQLISPGAMGGQCHSTALYKRKNTAVLKYSSVGRHTPGVHVIPTPVPAERQQPFRTRSPGASPSPLVFFAPLLFHLLLTNRTNFPRNNI